MIKTTVAFLEGRLLFSQSEQSEKFSKSSDWLVKSRPSKKPLLFRSCKQANTVYLFYLFIYLHSFYWPNK